MRVKTCSPQVLAVPLRSQLVRIEHRSADQRRVASNQLREAELELLLASNPHLPHGVHDEERARAVAAAVAVEKERLGCAFALAQLRITISLAAISLSLSLVRRHRHSLKNLVEVAKKRIGRPRSKS